MSATDLHCPTCAAGTASARSTVEAPSRRVILDAPPHPDTTAAPPPPAAVPPRRAEPPRPARAAPAGSAGGPAATGTVTGTVEQQFVDAFGPRERRLVAASGTVGVVAVVVLLVAGGAHRGSGLVFLLPTLAVLVAVLAAPFVIPGDRARTPSLRFRLTEVSGRVHECELRGAVDPLGAGDLVEVFGRHAGAVLRADEIVRGEDRLHGRSPLAFQIVHHAGVVAAALAVVCAVGVGVFVVTA
jgi:hypothetical protein